MDCKSKTKLKKDDNVKILSGKEKGKTGRILRIDTKKEQVIVQGLNLVKKAVRRKSQQDKGGIIEIEAPIHISNVALLSKGAASRVGYTYKESKKVRIAKKSGEVL